MSAEMLPPCIPYVKIMWLRACSIYAKLKLMAVILAIISTSATYRNQSTSLLKYGTRCCNVFWRGLAFTCIVSFTRSILYECSHGNCKTINLVRQQLWACGVFFTPTFRPPLQVAQSARITIYITTVTCVAVNIKTYGL